MKEENCPSPLRLPPILRQPLSNTGLYIPRDNTVYPKSNHEELSQQAYGKMTSSSQNKYIPAVIKGHRHFGFGGSVLPDSVIVQQYYDLTQTKRSNIRLNDQLLTICICACSYSKKMIKVDIPREHPYSSHISRYPAIFPSYRSPVQPASASSPVLVWRHHQKTKI
ncbi:hypothetical protein G5714_016344 [Onychostoma macrolepis]|uniref:Uncharacterized protein n=1 Tax=Onychostoma macrolepis TaxID=369639 RepID=A0A7J6C8U6_9TELE|nr:hypothetical protein G5714_016344 [Onychostoma macrolepis]